MGMTGLNSDLTIWEREKDIKKAINCFMAVLRIRKEDKFQQEWAETLNNLGKAYSDLHTDF
jgi:hypothetical protein